MLNPQQPIYEIEDSVKLLIKEGHGRTDIDQFLDNIITACIDLKNKIPLRTQKKYFSDQLAHLKGIMDDGDTIEDDINDLLKELRD